ncbi:prolyl 4-hydroxylase subunit alpha-2-like [Paramacrobiotus metropolitanus]|uniref:prolyl 4-hydroxylase subunit alpha-2-like n=1 Tax=Paramacrobiotus metropolitanus TaxID=2943436 RepID=UPI002445D57C|nr:prolyl 4-hydroxylase subunit alpha-2-like [Paramacrobiotus metropolitanus]
MEFHIKVFAVVVLASLLPIYVSSDIFASMVDVETLMDTEKNLLDILRETAQKEIEKLTLAKRYISKFKKAYNSHVDDTWEDIATSPIKAFQFIKHVTADWKLMSTKIEESIVNDRTASVRLLRSERRFPDEDDIKGSALAFNRLQNTYKIQPRDIAYGKVPGTRRTPAFTSREAFIVGHQQALEKQFNSASAWLEVSLDIFNTETVKTQTHTELLDWLQYSIFHDSGNAYRALELMKDIQKIDPTYANIPDNLKTYGGIVENGTAAELERMKSEVIQPKYIDDHYAALCRGEDLMDPELSRDLVCYLETYDNPYLLIQPVKLELANLDPVVYVVYNAILDSQAERIKKIGPQHLFRAKVIAQNSTQGVNSDTRISKIAFLEESVDEVIKTVNAYTGHATNLNASLAEHLQINNYGVGGYYYSHYDFFRDKEGVGHHLIESKKGDRIATFLMYMSDVESGGATVFPHLNVTLFPVKGAAAFWYNLHMDGEPDQRTLHSGCPVLSGMKWVSNKWFREGGQYVTRPCALFQDSPEPEPNVVSANTIVVASA